MSTLGAKMFVFDKKTQTKLGVWIGNETSSTPSLKFRVTHYLYRRPDGKIRKINAFNALKSYR